jgi:hypothetical protein
LYAAFVWARRALKHQKRRFPARAVFGIAAMKLYGDVDYTNPATHNVAINVHAHFGDIKHSMMLLAQIATGVLYWRIYQ